MDINIESIGDDDLIKRFLIDKLHEVKLSTDSLERQVVLRRSLLNEPQKDSDNGLLRVTQIWRNIHQNYFVTGMRIENTNSTSPLENVSVILDAGENFHVTLRFNLYVESDGNRSVMETIGSKWMKTNHISDKAILIVIIPIVDLAKPINVRWKCCVVGEWKTGGYLEEILFTDEICLNAADFTDPQMIIQKENILKGTSTSVLSLISLMKRRGCRFFFEDESMKSELPELLSNKLNLQSIIDSSMFFCSNDKIIIDILDGGVNFAKVCFYSCDDEDVLHILHKIATSMPGVLILPDNIEFRHSQYCNISHCEDTLRSSLSKEVQQLRKISDHFRLSQSSRSNKKSIKLRVEMIELEFYSDKCIETPLFSSKD